MCNGSVMNDECLCSYVLLQLNQHVAKKIWDDDKGGGDAAAKAMFPGAANPWSRDDGWNANPAGKYQCSQLTHGPGTMDGMLTPLVSTDVLS